MEILTQFLFRLSFGLALAMACTPSHLVTSGFYRVHLLVLMGMHVLTTLVALYLPDFNLWPPLLSVLLCYFGSVAWLVQWPKAGMWALYLVVLSTLWGALLAWPPVSPPWSLVRSGIAVGDVVTSGLVLGITMAAMLLGHWYLNTPSMELIPLKRLVVLMISVLTIRAVFCSCGSLVWYMEISPQSVGNPLGYLLVLRWLFGLVGAMVLAFMTWATLKVPNTQSATGILYVAVMATFLGELISLLLSLDAPYPV